MKKYIAILIMISIFVTFGLFTGCNDENNDLENENNINNVISNNNKNNINNDTTNNNENNVEDNINDVVADRGEKYTITYMGKETHQTDMEENRFVELALEDKFNIELEFSPIVASEKQQISLLIAASSLPDCGWVYSGVSPQLPIDYYNNGVTRGVPLDLVEKNCPFFWQMMQEDPSYSNYQTDEESGDYFTMFAFRYNYDKLGWGLLIRLDWMENLGYVPIGNVTNLEDEWYITDESYLMDDFQDLIYDFTYSDPDMNGEDDTTGHLAYSDWIWDHLYHATVFSAYGMHEYYTPMENGWGIPTSWSNAAKKAYIKINEWIDLKIINTDLASCNSESWQPRWVSGEYGSRTNLIGFLTVEEDGRDGPLFKNVPGSKLLIAPSLKDNDGSGGATSGYSEHTYTPSAGFFYVNVNVDDNKLERILQLYEYMFINPEGDNFCNHGVEGVHYEINPETLEIAPLDQTELTVEERVKHDAFASPCVSKAVSPTNLENSLLRHRVFKYSIENWLPTTHSWIIAPPAAELNLDLPWYQRENKQARNKIEAEFISRVFEGGSNIETAWDTMMQTFDDMGFQDYLRDLNENAWLDLEFRDGEKVHPADKYPE